MLPENEHKYSHFWPFSSTLFNSSLNTSWSSPLANLISRFPGAWQPFMEAEQHLWGWVGAPWQEGGPPHHRKPVEFGPLYRLYDYYYINHPLPSSGTVE